MTVDLEGQKALCRRSLIKAPTGIWMAKACQDSTSDDSYDK
jgi:hypothetical protein